MQDHHDVPAGILRRRVRGQGERASRGYFSTLQELLGVPTPVRGSRLGQLHLARRRYPARRRRSCPGAFMAGESLRSGIPARLREARVSANVLGTMYSKGAGVAREVNKASELYKIGCDGGSASSCTSLGLAHMRGEGVNRDAGKGVKLFEKACAARDAAGCLQLGFALRAGQGIEIDPTRAATRFEQACKMGLDAGCAERAAR